VQQTALHHYVAEAASPIAWMEPSTTMQNGEDPVWCIGCHASVSDDGSRIALATMPGAGLPARGAIIDVVTKSFLSVDATANWTSSTYDPSGMLITALSGTLTLRDGETAAVLQTLTTDGPAASPEVSPDGSLLLYGVLDPTSPSMITREIHVHPWDATTGTLGPSRVLVAPDGSGIKDPVFSNDGTWLLYGHASTPAGGATDKGGLRAVRTDGSATPIDLAVDSGDSIAGWASELTPDGAWIAIKTRRTVGGRTQPPQLWMAYFDPTSGTISTPFHLPGQPANMTMNHAPRRLRD
jgi:Tol biopolymer transport system component